jgi:hypothetical protein
VSALTTAPEPLSRDATDAECQALLERVINSRELKRAQRLRELLAYLGRRSLKPHAQAVREQEIGAAMFGRREDYDTSLDNIVRVTVSELRKRLAHYFQTEGADEPIVMEIPRGAYVPVFFDRPPTLRERQSPATLRAPETTGAFLLDTDIPVKPVDTPPDSSPQADTPAHSGTPPAAQAQSATSGPGAWALGIALLSALLGCAVLGWQNYRLRAQTDPWKTEPVRAALWSQFFASGDEVDVVTADTSFALAEDILGRPITLDDYQDYRYKSFAEDPSLSRDTRAALTMVLDRNNGSIGDFQAAEKFLELNAHARSVKLIGARAYTPEAMETNSAILIGARESNPWVELYKDRLNFSLEYEPGKQRSFIVNRNPMPGEKAVYEASERRSQGYSVVAFLPSLNPTRYTLIVSGSDSQATLAAGEFVTSSEGLAQIRQKMPTGRFPFFELVLSSSRMVGTTLTTEIVASRLHPR